MREAAYARAVHPLELALVDSPGIPDEATHLATYRLRIGQPPMHRA